jgi:hypothetical protein
VSCRLFLDDDCDDACAPVGSTASTRPVQARKQCAIVAHVYSPVQVIVEDEHEWCIHSGFSCSPIACQIIIVDNDTLRAQQPAKNLTSGQLLKQIIGFLQLQRRNLNILRSICNQ